MLLTKIINHKNKKMQRKTGFFTGIASAIIVFSVLYATIGKPKYFDKHYFKTACRIVNEPDTK